MQTPEPANAKRRRPLGRRLALATGVGLLALGALELLARSFFPGADAFYMYPPSLNQVFLPTTKLLPGVQERARFDINALGFRGDEPPPYDADAYRILAVGGSTTQCAFVDQPESWPTRLETLLEEASGRDVWVANAGRSGFTSRRHVVQLRHLLDQGPRYDLVLVLVGVNDLANRLEFGDTEPPRDELTYEGVPTAKCFTFVPTEHDDLNPWGKRLALFRALKVIQVHASLPDEQRIGKDYKRWRRNRRNATEVRPELPDLSAALEAYRHNLAACVALAREHGTRIVLVDQPSIWRDDLSEPDRKLLWMGGVGNYQNELGLPYYSMEALGQGMRLYNEALHALADEEGVESVPLAAAIPKDALHFYDDVHFNERGSLLVADVIAGWLLARPPFAE